jgi:trehalose-phosphatase
LRQDEINKSFPTEKPCHGFIELLVYYESRAIIGQLGAMKASSPYRRRINMTTAGFKNERESLPSALEQMEEIQGRAKDKKMTVFLDYDGTLTPIVESPEQAVLSQEMRQTVEQLARYCTVGIISGRDLEDVRQLVGIDSIYYAGSHGFDMAGPGGERQEAQQAVEFLPILGRAEKELEGWLHNLPGALVERKKFSLAAHYRKVAEDNIGAVETAVDQVLKSYPELRKSSGKKVFELQPKMDWHKGKALLWLLDELELNRPDVLPFYIGDDTTDEDGFRALRDQGITIVVAEGSRNTEAEYQLADPDEVGEFLQRLVALLKRGD